MPVHSLKIMPNGPILMKLRQPVFGVRFLETVYYIESTTVSSQYFLAELYC